MTRPATQPPPDRPQRALILRVPGHESAINAHRLARTAEQAGLSVCMAPYWPDGEQPWREEEPLLLQDIGSAPRLSGFAFKKQFGFDLDLVDLSLHLFATEPGTPDTVLPETIWSQKLRGVAATAQALFRRTKAEIIFVPHGAEVISRILAVVASMEDRKLLFWESGFFPNHLYVDPKAPHFFRGAAGIDALPLPGTPTPRARAFRDQWIADRRSKYPQPQSQQQLLTEWLSQDPRPVLFMAGQVPTDANAVVGLDSFETLDELYRAALDHVPEGWRILYKPHPLASHDPLVEAQLPPERFLRLDVDVHAALQACDAVLTHSSNVGLEALLYGKPVLTLGRPIYSERDLTISLPHPRVLKTVLAGATPPPPPASETVLTFLDLVLDEALIADGAGDALRHRIDRTVAGAPQEPRLQWYGASIRALAEAARALHDELRTWRRLDRALDVLAPTHRQTLERHIGLQAMEPHRFGGPITPRNRYAAPLMPDLDDFLGQEAAYSDVRLEHCIDPVRAVRNSSASTVFSLPSPSSVDENAIQRLNENDISEIARLSNRQISIIGILDSKYSDKNLSSTWILTSPANERPTGSVSYKKISLPIEAFDLTEKNGDAFTPRRYECKFKIDIPPGKWRISWNVKKRSKLETLIYRAYVFLDPRGKNHAVVKWRERFKGSSRVIKKTLFEFGALSVSARRGAEYELRLSLPMRHGSDMNALVDLCGVTLHPQPITAMRD